MEVKSADIGEIAKGQNPSNEHLRKKNVFYLFKYTLIVC